MHTENKQAVYYLKRWRKSTLTTRLTLWFCNDWAFVTLLTIMINSYLTECFGVLFNVRHQEEEEKRKESNFHLLHEAISRSSQSFTPLINLNLLKCKNRHCLHVCVCVSWTDLFNLVLSPWAATCSHCNVLDLFLLCCREVFACSVVTATRGLCSKTESLYPADPTQKLMCQTLLEYCYTRNLTICVCCMCVRTAIFVYTVWIYEGCKTLAASLETLGWQL